MPITAIHNMDTVVDGQIYIGKCVVTVQRIVLRAYLVHQFH